MRQKEKKSLLGKYFFPPSFINVLSWFVVASIFLTGHSEPPDYNRMNLVGINRDIFTSEINFKLSEA